MALVESFRQALASAGLPGRVVAADASPLSAACAAADVRALVPPCDDPAFLPEMLELCRREGVRLLVPTIDPELSVYAHARDAFAELGVTVAVSSPETVAIADDKRRTHAFLRERGIPTVDQVDVSPGSERPAGWAFPFVVKPVNGSSSVGVVVVDDETSLACALSQGDVVAQRLASGVEFTVDCLVDSHGEVLQSVPRERIEVRAGEVSKGRTVKSVPVIECARRVCQELPGPFGVLTVQLFHDVATDDIRVIEINPRFGGGYPLAQQAGADFTGWLVRRAHGDPTVVDLAWREGLVMLRYDSAVYLEDPVPGA